MATTPFLYHTLGLVGYKHLSTDYRGGEVYHHVRLRRHQRRCRHCRARWQALRLAGGFVREFRALPVGGRAQWVILHGHRQHCQRCGPTAREPVSFTNGNARYLKAFGRFAVGLCAIVPIKAVAGWLGFGWDLVRDLSLLCGFCPSARTFALGLPSDIPSRVCPCRRLVVIVVHNVDIPGTPTGDFHPISSCPCRAYTNACSRTKLLHCACNFTADASVRPEAR